MPSFRMKTISHVALVACLALEWMTSCILAESIYCDDPELCSMTKRFLRFGRAMKNDVNLDSTFDRVNRAYEPYQNKRFLRFGRAQEPDVGDYIRAAALLRSAGMLERKKRSVGEEKEEELVGQEMEEGEKVLHRARRSAETDVVEDNEVLDNDIQKRAVDSPVLEEEKRFMRFGRGGEEPEKRFMRFGKRFMRFGRAGGEDEKRFMRFGKRFMRFGRDAEAGKRFMRFGRNFYPEEEGDNEGVDDGSDESADDSVNKRFMRFGKRFMRFGKSVGEAEKRFMRFGKSLDKSGDEKRFMRFGKRFMRFGRDNGDKRFMRFGKRSRRSANEGVNSRNSDVISHTS